MPNTCRTPNATSVSTSTSATVRTAAGGSGRHTYTPSARSSTSYEVTPSEKPSGGLPLTGS